MKRFLIAASALVVIPSVVFLVFFTASKYRVKDQNYFVSLSDFVFMVGTYNAQMFGLETPELTDERYGQVMQHAHPKAHSEVRRRVVWSLERWGDEVAPRLIDELETFITRERLVAAAKALGRMQYVQALGPMVKAFDLAEWNRALQVDLVDAIADLGPEASPFLVETYRLYRVNDEDPLYNLLDAIGESGGGVEFLIAELGQSQSTEHILALEWPLAMTRDLRAARALVQLLHHPRLSVRRRARDSMSQYMGAVAVGPAVELLATETDDYIRSWIINSLLATRAASESSRAVELLGNLLGDPTVSDDANYALARIGTEEAIEHLRNRTRYQSPRWVIDNLEYTGVVALRILEDYLHHPEQAVRRAAVWKIQELEEPEAIPILQSFAADTDPYTGNLIRNTIFQMDLLLLERSFSDWFSKRTGTNLGRARPPSRKGIRVTLSALSFLHWVGLGLSALLGLLLLSGRLRAFEHYKFALVIQFLLVLGMLGDFFFINSGPQLYNLATGGRLLLLLGLLFLRDDPLPGETQGRVERITVRSLWVLVPLFLIFGVPLFSEALRLSLRDFDFMKWALLLLVVLTILLFEQALLPWDFLARGGWAESTLAFLLSGSVVVLFGFPMWWWILEQSAAGQRDRATLGALFLAPLLVALVFHANACRRNTRRSKGSSGKFPRPPRRIHAFYDGQTLLIRLKQKRRFRGLPQLVFGLVLLAATWLLCHSFEVTGGGGPGLFLMMILAVVGTVLIWLVLSGLSPTFSIQLRNGAVRSATSFLGAAFGRPVWYRRLRLPALARQLQLTSHEKRWLTKILREERSVPRLDLSLRAVGNSTKESLPMELQVQNRGDNAIRLEDIEANEGTPWAAEVNGQVADVFFSREEREYSIPPGTTQTFHPRLYATGLGSSAPLSVVLRCGSTGPRVQLSAQGIGS